MSDIKIHFHRFNDKMSIRVLLHGTYEGEYDFCTVSFKCGDCDLNVISTSSGYVDHQNIVYLNKAYDIELYIEYCTEDKVLECLVGYYQNKDLHHYETLTALFDNSRELDPVLVSASIIKTVPGDFRDKMKDFKQTLSRWNSSWNVSCSVHDECIFLKLKKLGRNPCIMSFGELSDQILSTDYIFSVEPGQTSMYKEKRKNKMDIYKGSFMAMLYIPKEIVKSKSSSYNPMSSLGIFELIKPDFLDTKDIYYKSLISNTLPVEKVL